MSTDFSSLVYVSEWKHMLSLTDFTILLVLRGQAASIEAVYILVNNLLLIRRYYSCKSCLTFVVGYGDLEEKKKQHEKKATNSIE